MRAAYNDSIIFKGEYSIAGGSLSLVDGNKSVETEKRPLYNYNMD